MIELERTYLAKYIPKDIAKFKSREIIDIYIPVSDPHPVLRIRKNGNNFEMTKKKPISPKDKSVQNEQTISLSQEEYEALEKIKGKKVSKIRFYYSYAEGLAEVDVFQEKLSGLVLVDFEFENEKEKSNFKMPEFCLAEVTQEKFIAGGMLCGKKYGDIKKRLDKFNYKKIIFKNL